MLHRIFAPLAIATALFAVACSDEPVRPTVVSSVPKAPAATNAPAAVDTVRAIYAGYAKSPDRFDRTPVLSRFYVEDNRAVDAACAAGEDHRRCRGDRFSCVAVPPKKAGNVVDAVLLGEQPGVSASVKVTLQFGATVTKADVDVVLEDGAWKIDQVRCD